MQLLLARDGVEVVDTQDTVRRAFPVGRVVALPAVAGPDDAAWLSAWQAADASVSEQLDRLIDEAGFTAYHVAAAVSRGLPPGGHLVVGASNPIRDLDLMATAYDVGSRRKVIANRGLSGIDGTVSTAIGASLARKAESRNLALMGDVTFLHDATGLVIGPDEPRPDLTIVVANDDGGSIFATLEQGAPTSTRTPTSGCSAPRTTSTWARSAQATGTAALAGQTRRPSSTTPWPARTAASRWSRPSSTAATGASWTRRSVHSVPEA